MHNGDHRRSVRLESRDWTARAVKPRRVWEPPPMKGLNDGPVAHILHACAY